MSVSPLEDRIVVEVHENGDERTEGGLYIPDTAQEKPQTGTVRAVGPGKVTDTGERVAPDVQPGDTVLFGKYSGTEVDVEGEEILLLRESDVLARVE